MKPESSALVVHKDDLPREARKTADTTFDRIYKFYHNDKTRIDLDEKEKIIADRWEKAWFLLCSHKTVKKVCDEIEVLFKVKKSVAYDDVRCAMMLFSDPRQSFQDAKRIIAETSFLQGAEKMWELGDYPMHLKYMQEYAEINRLKEGTNESKLAEMVQKMKPAQIIIVSSKQDLESEAKRIQEQLTHDIDHEEQ